MNNNLEKKLKDIIYDIERQLECADKEDMNDASWVHEHGILISGNQAKLIEQIINDILNKNNDDIMIQNR